MDINHYVIQDVSSVDTADQKLLYTHHTNMETPSNNTSLNILLHRSQI